MLFKTPKQFSIFLAFAVGFFSILAEVIVNLAFGLEIVMSGRRIFREPVDLPVVMPNWSQQAYGPR
jgi:ABC-type sulfate transport system permease component